MDRGARRLRRRDLDGVADGTPVGTTADQHGHVRVVAHDRDRPALPALPDGVPSGSQSVPFLMLENGVAVRLGMAEREVKSRSLARATAGPPAVEPGVFDQRITLPFRDGRSRFWVVLEKTGPGREREVTAIYVR